MQKEENLLYSTTDYDASVKVRLVSETAKIFPNDDIDSGYWLFINADLYLPFDLNGLTAKITLHTDYDVIIRAGKIKLRKTLLE